MLPTQLPDLGDRQTFPGQTLPDRIEPFPGETQSHSAVRAELPGHRNQQNVERFFKKDLLRFHHPMDGMKYRYTIPVVDHFTHPSQNPPEPARPRIMPCFPTPCKVYSLGPVQHDLFEILLCLPIWYNGRYRRALSASTGSTKLTAKRRAGKVPSISRP